MWGVKTSVLRKPRLHVINKMHVEKMMRGLMVITVSLRVPNLNHRKSNGG